MRHLKRLMTLLAVLSIMLFAIVVFAADDDLLQYIPAIVKAQQTVNPVGTYTGSGIVTMGSCACNIASATVTVSDGPVSGSYKVSYDTINTTDCVAEYGSCSWNDGGSNFPAVIDNKQLIFGNASRGSYDYQSQTFNYQVTTNGILDFTNTTPVFIKNSAHQVTSTSSQNAYDAIVRLTLQKNP